MWPPRCPHLARGSRLRPLKSRRRSHVSLSSCWSTIGRDERGAALLETLCLPWAFSLSSKLHRVDRTTRWDKTVPTNQCFPSQEQSAPRMPPRPGQSDTRPDKRDRCSCRGLKSNGCRGPLQIHTAHVGALCLLRVVVAALYRVAQGLKRRIDGHKTLGGLLLCFVAMPRVRVGVACLGELQVGLRGNGKG
jgi:hypothetical protein